MLPPPKLLQHHSFSLPFGGQQRTGNFEQVIIQLEVDEGQNADFHLKMQILSQKVLGQPK